MSKTGTVTEDHPTSKAQRFSEVTRSKDRSGCMERTRTHNEIVEGAISRELFAAVNWSVSESTGWPACGDVDDDLLEHLNFGLEHLNFGVAPAIMRSLAADSERKAQGFQEFLHEVMQARLQSLSMSMCGEPIREMNVTGSSKKGWWLHGQAGGDFKLPGTKGCRTWEEAVEAAENWVQEHLMRGDSNGP